MDALWEWMKTDLDVITVGKSPFPKKALLPPPPPAPPRPSLSAGPGFSWPDKAKSVGSVTQPLPTTTTTTTTLTNNASKKAEEEVD